MLEKNLALGKVCYIMLVFSNLHLIQCFMPYTILITLILLVNFKIKFGSFQESTEITVVMAVACFVCYRVDRFLSLILCVFNTSTA